MGKKTVTHIIDIFVGKQSRKVAFGVWGFIAANALISEGKIDMIVYWKMFLTCALLIGFGTVLDAFLNKISDKVAGSVAGKINATLEQPEAAS